jgi:hypothetical protein
MAREEEERDVHLERTNDDLDPLAHPGIHPGTPGVHLGTHLGTHLGLRTLLRNLREGVLLGMLLVRCNLLDLLLRPLRIERHLLGPTITHISKRRRERERRTNLADEERTSEECVVTQLRDGLLSLFGRAEFDNTVHLIRKYGQRREGGEERTRSLLTCRWEAS